MGHGVYGSSRIPSRAIAGAGICVLELLVDVVAVLAAGLLQRLVLGIWRCGALRRVQKPVFYRCELRHERVFPVRSALTTATAHIQV